MEPFVKTIHPRGVLSFAPDSEPLPLTPLNVLIGPNASGKSNLIEIFKLLKSLPTDLDEVMREGGGSIEWLWKGEGKARAAIGAEFSIFSLLLRYRLELGEFGVGIDETIENAGRTDGAPYNWEFLYRIQHGRPVLRIKKSALPSGMAASGEALGDGEVALSSSQLDRRQSVLSQRRDSDLYPELFALGGFLKWIQIYRDWGFGRSVPLRQPQPADLPNDVVMPDGRNLGLILNAIYNTDLWARFDAALRRFLPRFKRLTTVVDGGTVQIFLHEEGLRVPVPATRLSDGTIRFITLLAILLKPGRSLICLEEPEKGLHPDALTLIAELLVSASQETQIVVTTQSDVLVSALSEHAESVIVCDNVAGASRFRRLESDKLRFWMDKYRLGEIWRIGELGGNP